MLRAPKAKTQTGGRRLLPALPIRYLADSAFFPYGERPPQEVEARSAALTQQLIAEGCDLVVVACNTASSAALERLRAQFTIPEFRQMVESGYPRIAHSQKASGFVCGLSTRKVFTPRSIQYRKMSRQAFHKFCRSSHQKLIG